MGLQNGALTDADGNGITSQAQGASEALDVGINVAGVQVDPRDTRALTTATDSVTVGASALPTGAATEAKQDAQEATLTAIAAAQATAANQATANSSLASIATNQATAAKQDTGNTTLAAIAAAQATAAKQDTGNASLASIATNQATAAKQDTGNTSLAAIAAGTPTSLGQKTSANSQGVVIASDQPAIATKGASGSLTDRSGTTSGTIHTSTQMMPANASRKYLFIQNVSPDPMWVNFTTTAAEAQPSIQIPSLGSFVMESGYVSTEAINVICKGASRAYTAKEA